MKKNNTTRLDVWLVENGHFESRQKAVFAIKKGAVQISGVSVLKSSFLVSENDAVTITSPGLKFVSQGGLKMEKAILQFNLDVTGMKVLDIGASTGGFSDCLLQYGAETIFCVDVGSNQLHTSLRNNPKVKWKENCDIRNLHVQELPFSFPDLVVVDVSFISIKTLIPILKKFCSGLTKLIVLVKPQFEMEEKKNMKNGIVKNKILREKVFHSVKQEFIKNQFQILGETETDLNEEKKNLEYLLLLKTD